MNYKSSMTAEKYVTVNDLPLTAGSGPHLILVGVLRKRHRLGNFRLREHRHQAVRGTFRHRILAQSSVCTIPRTHVFHTCCDAGASVAEVTARRQQAPGTQRLNPVALLGSRGANLAVSQETVPRRENGTRNKVGFLFFSVDLSLLLLMAVLPLFRTWKGPAEYCVHVLGSGVEAAVLHSVSVCLREIASGTGANSRSVKKQEGTHQTCTSPCFSYARAVRAKGQGPGARD